MGNICGKTDSKNFSSPGRTVGIPSPSAPKTAPLPKKVGGPPRTLGGAARSTEDTSQGQVDARRKAAEAAEVRYWQRFTE